MDRPRPMGLLLFVFPRGVRRPQLTLSDHLKKKLFRYHHNFFLHVYGVNSLAGIDFQQFLKNKMAANFLLTQNIDDVLSIKGKVMNISSPNVLYGYKVA